MKIFEKGLQSMKKAVENILTFVGFTAIVGCFYVIGFLHLMGYDNLMQLF